MSGRSVSPSGAISDDSDAERQVSFTGKQEAFMRWYCSADVRMNGTEAARRAGYRGNDATLRAVASENLTKPNIRKEIDKRMDIALSRTNVTIERVLSDLEMIRIRATNENRFTAAIRCLELQGKYLRMWTDKIERPPTIEDLGTKDLVQLIREISESGNLDVFQIIDEHKADSG